MPKIIPGLQQRLLETSRGILSTEGYAAFSIRRVAGECGVAVGTVYNYFHEKNDIVACIMLEDWADTLAAMDEVAAKSSDFVSDMCKMYHWLKGFVNKNRTVWEQFTGTGGSMSVVTNHHRQLCEQIGQRIDVLTHNTHQQGLKLCIPLLTELLLAAALREDITEAQTRALLERIAQ